ncbi:DNA polymerase ligase N-terminal domain-containing protein [Sciscionella sediminilitoris]|uniref:DNA polymerase ligase N-terminal domain-containing protein n=1 Tax=Sciscionella sediminilitoris TaxID=1445613 RepID=UPI0004DFA7ED|nr:DNA polymerase ligase N-terminal domain-containing protein [Sciscionella sp. SE31]
MTKKTGNSQLTDYHGKRDFTRTAEPISGTSSPDGCLFVVQRHRARRLHYDLRLELEGVLVSWAVPKGPTLDPEVRRLAIHVEDHPLDYAWFEGVIPAGEYGGGDVIVWDRGDWVLARERASDAKTAIQRGNLHFDLYGEKLAGRFVLAHRSGDQWLLLHKHDQWAVSPWDPEAHPFSVLSGRNNEQVAAAPE